MALGFVRKKVSPGGSPLTVANGELELSLSWSQHLCVFEFDFQLREKMRTNKEVEGYLWSVSV